MDLERPEPSSADALNLEPPAAAFDESGGGCKYQDTLLPDAEVMDQVCQIKQLFVEQTDNYAIPPLERLYTRIIKGYLKPKMEWRTTLSTQF